MNNCGWIKKPGKAVIDIKNNSKIRHKFKCIRCEVSFFDDDKNWFICNECKQFFCDKCNNFGKINIYDAHCQKCIQLENNF